MQVELYSINTKVENYLISFDISPKYNLAPDIIKFEDVYYRHKELDRDNDIHRYVRSRFYAINTVTDKVKAKKVGG